MATLNAEPFPLSSLDNHSAAYLFYSNLSRSSSALSFKVNDPPKKRANLNPQKMGFRKCKPKKAMSAYIIFLKETLRNRPPGTPAVISQELADRWKTLPALDKLKYAALAEKDRDRYRDEMKHFESIQPSGQVMSPTKSLDFSESRPQIKTEPAPIQHRDDPFIRRSFDITAVFEPLKSLQRSVSSSSALHNNLSIFGINRANPMSPPIVPQSAMILKVKVQDNALAREIRLFDSTLSALYNEITRKLNIQRVKAIIKLPDILIGDDEDVRRLQPFTELKVLID
eukprot:GILJ01010700.1.p1 GENE.GILJ01010700.1~~GILJ01010700.1.p1  ORF type:complete len:284 (+),score=46.37 GILJ01010700.1:58-909(+)